eukprot:COSAG05_NODE_265_length_12666_cov_104.645739_13_plen_67_part_00
MQIEIQGQPCIFGCISAAARAARAARKMAGRTAGTALSTESQYSTTTHYAAVYVTKNDLGPSFFPQ